MRKSKTKEEAVNRLANFVIDDIPPKDWCEAYVSLLIMKKRLQQVIEDGDRKS